VKNLYLRMLTRLLQGNVSKHFFGWLGVEVVIFVRGHEVYHKEVTHEDISSIADLLRDAVVHEKRHDRNGPHVPNGRG
jgi:hypothetical protein